MSRAGRKRKNKARHDCGKLVQDKRPDDRLRIGAQPHRNVLPEKKRVDERAESPLGRLYLAGGLLTDAERRRGDDLAEMRYEAGILWGAIVGAWRAVIEAPNGVGVRAGRGFSCIAQGSDSIDSCRNGPADCECLRRKERYDQMFEALSRAGRRAALAVNRIAVHREMIAHDELGHLIAGLDALAEAGGLTRRSARIRTSRAGYVGEPELAGQREPQYLRDGDWNGSAARSVRAGEVPADRAAVNAEDAGGLGLGKAEAFEGGAEFGGGH